MRKKQLLTIIRPAGNDTALIAGIPAEKKERKRINDCVMQQFPNVEQVGFYALKPTPRLEMAGGEFCGNALRSFAYLCLQGEKGTVSIQMSGTQKILEAGIIKRNTAFAQMPIQNDFAAIRQLTKTLTKVQLEGITQLITKLQTVPPTAKLKEKAKTMLEKNNLLQTQPAAGVMFVQETNNKIILNPVVWVRDIQTLFFETACASGTTAVALSKSLFSKEYKQTFSIQQPSGSYLDVCIEKNDTSFEKARIDGVIDVLWKEEIII